MDRPVYLIYLISICGLLFALYLLAQGKKANQAFIVAAISAALALFAPLVVADVKNANVILLCMVAGAIGGLIFLTQRSQIAFALSLTPLGFATTTIALAICLHEGVRNTMNTQEIADTIQRLALAITLWAGGITLCGAPIAAWKIRSKNTQSTEKKSEWKSNVNKQLNQFLWGAATVITIVVVFIPIFIVFPIIAVLASISGVTLVAAMKSKQEQAILPAVFNTFGGITACALGFVLGASVLIVAGALLGAAGVGFCKNVALEHKMPLRLYSYVIFGRK